MPCFNVRTMTFHISIQSVAKCLVGLFEQTVLNLHLDVIAGIRSFLGEVFRSVTNQSFLEEGTGQVMEWLEIIVNRLFDVDRNG